MFIGLIFGLNWAGKFAAKREGQMKKIKAIRAGSTIRALQEEAEEATKS